MKTIAKSLLTLALLAGLSACGSANSINTDAEHVASAPLKSQTSNCRQGTALTLPPA